MTDEEYSREIALFAKSEAVKRLLGELEDRYTLSWKTSRPEDDRARAHHYNMVTSVNALRSEIQAFASNERISAHNKTR